MHVNRGLVFWGVALIAAGAVALAIQSGLIAAESARELWRFWPLVLVFIGVAILAARTPFALVATVVAGLAVGGIAGTLVGGLRDGMNIGCAGEVDNAVSESGAFDGSAGVVLDFNCGELAVSTADGAGWSLDARHAGDEPPEITASGSSLRVVADGDHGLGFGDRRQEWELTLPAEPEIDLSVNANAASSDLDLDGATLGALAIDANAGEVELRLPGAVVEGFSVDGNAGSISIEADDATELDGSVEMNAGSLELCVPGDVSLAITIDEDNITFDHDLDESDLTREGDTWRSGDGTAAVDLEVSGNAANFSLNPEDGCS